MCISRRDVELCRCCQHTVVEESTAHVHRCHLFSDEDEDMHCMTLERSDNSFVSNTLTCRDCSNGYGSMFENRGSYNRSSFSDGSSGGSSGDTSYSRGIGSSENESSDDESDNDSDDD
ncbi:unnamed protein product [Tilletia controversa]|uniref:Uncharacterized protein n=3 Tax=Tilletia TaxID=13289 RepID=A0A8X7T0R1_9BASI|nr:hypothetical protein CF336_g1122 [Tilletia laevis]KAE8205690.1 hypothetical protein CF328_g351 [Tilletia controversa]KAE8263169.1 hypothetical protein A4X03_0g1887 [Tilletia caries]KAE8206723.1 hypothetical protein CF335_g1662 [Tilletia laevis]KAE8255365.1 hypothetical protein A4X06_0g463 [Tilletia controversa]